MKTVAVIGYGGQGAWHCARIMENNVAKLVGIYDIKENRRQLAKEKGIFVYESNDAIFADSNVDIIVVATPNDIHKELVIKGLSSGHNVICEKPVALSTAEFDCMVEAAEKSGKMLSVHQNRRWDADFLAIKSIIDNNEMGEVLRIESRVQGSRGVPGDWRQKKQYGGGMILDWGVHLIDQMLQLIKEKIVSVDCYTTDYTNKEVDDGFRLELAFESGKSAYIEVGTYNFLSLPRFYMQCESGGVLIGDWNSDITVAKIKEWDEKEVAPVQTAAGITKTMAPRAKDSLEIYDRQKPSSDAHDYYRNYCDALDGKAEMLIKHYEVRRVLTVMETAFKSANEKCRIEVNI